MADLESWLASWAKLRGVSESQSFAHPNVHLCLWRDRKFSVAQSTMRICDVLHLSDHWHAANSKGNSTKTKIARQFVMGIGGLQSVGPWTWWLMHERLAEAAQRSRAPDAIVDAELDRAGDVQTTFTNLAEHASDLLGNIPKGTGIRLPNDATTAGPFLWITVLFDIAGLPNVDPTRVTGGFPRFVPRNCLGAESLEIFPDLRVLRRNPFCESVAVIDWLTKDAKKPSPANWLPVVDLELSQVRYEGKCHNVTPEAALLISKLVEQYPDYFSASSLWSKPSDIRARLPQELQVIIETSKGKGYRLKRLS